MRLPIEDFTVWARPMRPGEPIDWEFERFWVLMSPQWPGVIKETLHWYFNAGRIRIEEYLATATCLFEKNVSWSQNGH